MLLPWLWGCLSCPDFIPLTVVTLLTVVTPLPMSHPCLCHTPAFVTSCSSFTPVCFCAWLFSHMVVSLCLRWCLGGRRKGRTGAARTRAQEGGGKWSLCALVSFLYVSSVQTNSACDDGGLHLSQVVLYANWSGVLIQFFCPLSSSITMLLQTHFVPSCCRLLVFDFFYYFFSRIFGGFVIN